MKLYKFGGDILDDLDKIPETPLWLKELIKEEKRKKADRFEWKEPPKPGEEVNGI